MSNGSGGPLNTSAGGVAGAHPAPDGRTVKVGPTTADKHNRLRISVFPIACWRVDDIRFEFDSSFVLPDIADEMALLAKEVDTHTHAGDKPPLSIFGHADPVGNDDYNKKLSGRRAAAIYALIARRTDIWEDIFKNKGKFSDPLSSDSWGGLKAIQTMLVQLGHLDNADGTAIDGQNGPKTKAAVEAFQGSPEGAGLNVDGDPGPLTREKLFKAYMDSICKKEDGSNFELAKTDFLGNGDDETGKADFQGCSEFNPLFLFSEEEQKRFRLLANKEERDTENAPNRRVVAFLFRPDLRVNPAKWPCPRAKEGVAKCKDRFWSDGETRRTRREPDARRDQRETKDVFGCRFYDRMAGRSPCEGFFAGLTEEWVIKVLKPVGALVQQSRPGGPGAGAGEPLPSPAPEEREPFANENFVLTGVGGATPEVTGTTDAAGVLRVSVSADPATMTLTIGGIKISLNGGALPPIDAVGDNVIKHRLFNLGYGKDNFDEWGAVTLTDAIKKFQRDHGLPETGSVDDATRRKLKQVYGS